MTPQAILNSLVVEGFDLVADGNALELRGPLHRLSPEMRQAIRTHKDGLLKMLQLPPPPAVVAWPTFDMARQSLEMARAPAGWTFAVATPLPMPRQFRSLCTRPWATSEATAGVTELRELPTVIDAKDCPEGWQDDESYVWIGRQSKRLGLARSMFYNPHAVRKGSGDEGRKKAVDRFRNRLETTGILRAQAKAWLPGKTLVCNCGHRPCHGEAIVEFLDSQGLFEEEMSND